MYNGCLGLTVERRHAHKLRPVLVERIIDGDLEVAILHVALFAVCRIGCQVSNFFDFHSVSSYSFYMINNTVIHLSGIVESVLSVKASFQSLLRSGGEEDTA